MQKIVYILVISFIQYEWKLYKRKKNYDKTRKKMFFFVIVASSTIKFVKLSEIFKFKKSKLIFQIFKINFQNIFFAYIQRYI